MYSTASADWTIVRTSVHFRFRYATSDEDFQKIHVRNEGFASHNSTTIKAEQYHRHEEKLLQMVELFLKRTQETKPAGFSPVANTIREFSYILKKELCSLLIFAVMTPVLEAERNFI